jgi:hypothetical protein
MQSSILRESWTGMAEGRVGASCHKRRAEDSDRETFAGGTECDLEMDRGALTDGKLDSCVKPTFRSTKTELNNQTEMALCRYHGSLYLFAAGGVSARGAATEWRDAPDISV